MTLFSVLSRIIFFIAAIVAGYYVMSVFSLSTSSQSGAGQVEELAGLMQDMDRSARDYKSFSEENRQRIIERIADEMAPVTAAVSGGYPVKIFDSSSEIQALDQTLYLASPAWLDNRHVAYWGSSGRAEGVPPVVKYKLLIFDTEEGKAVHTLAEHDHAGIVCFDPKTRNFYYSLPGHIEVERKGRKERGTFFNYGTIDENLKFTEVANNKKYPDILWIPSACTFIKRGEAYHPYVRPEDGEVKESLNLKGEFTHIRPDGTNKTFNINLPASGDVRYDKIRDQYYIAVHFSLEDQRIRVFYYDRNFNPVNEYTLPRLFGYSTTSPILDFPVKGGFAFACYAPQKEMPNSRSRADKNLCYVRYDGTITRILDGEVSYNIAVSPDGCRIFGRRKETSDAPEGAARNFVVTICN